MSSGRAARAGSVLLGALVLVGAAGCTVDAAPRPTASGRTVVAAPSMTTVGVGAPRTTSVTYTDITPDELGLVSPQRLPREIARYVTGIGGSSSTRGDAVVDQGEPRYEVLAACLGVGGPVDARYELSRAANLDGVAHGGPDDTSGSIVCDGTVKRIEVSSLPAGPTGIELIDPRDEAVRGYAILVRLPEGAPR